MNVVMTFHELDKLYESADEQVSSQKSDKADGLFERALSISDMRAFYDTATGIDKDKYPNFFAWYDAQVKAGKYKTEAFVEPDEGLRDSVALSAEQSEVSVVDMVKSAYEAGAFSKLPVGRQNAIMLDIYSVDKERLAAYFRKQPEFSYELVNVSGIVSHKFVSAEYEIEIFDTFISMFKVAKRESFYNDKKVCLEYFNKITKENDEMNNFVSIFEQLSNLYEADGAAGFRLDGKTISTIEDLADELSRDRGDDSYIKKYLKELNQDITVEDLAIAVEQSDYPRQIKALIARMKSKGFKTIGDFAKSFEEVKESFAATEEPTEELTEDADEEFAGEDTEPQQVAMECTKCGAICLCDIADLVVDSETDLANVEQPCNFCEETEGYKVVGAIIPYDSEEVIEIEDDEIGDTDETVEQELTDGDLEEGIFSKKKKNNASGSGAGNSQQAREVTIQIYDENGTEQFAHTFTENPGKMTAEEQLGELLKKSYPKLYTQVKNNGNEWMYDKKSDPASSTDTNPRFNNFVSKLNIR